MRLGLNLFNLLILFCFLTRWALAKDETQVVQPVKQMPFGDGSALLVEVENQQVLTTHLDVLPDPSWPTDEGLQVESYEKARFLVQCAGEVWPNLWVKTGNRALPVESQPMHMAKAPPALWVTSANRGRANLEKLLHFVQPDLPLEHRALGDVPESFGALRFAPLILIDSQDWGLLTPYAKKSLRDAVLAGSVLVVSTGYESDEDALSGLTHVRLGPSGRPGAALAHALPRVSSRRELKLQGEARALVMADGLPVLTEEQRGLGLVRVLAVSLNDLMDGPVLQKALAPRGPSLEKALSWFEQLPVPSSVGSSFFSWRVWFFCLSLAALLFFPLRSKALRWCLLGLWGLLAFVIAPTGNFTRLERLQTLQLRSGQENLYFGVADVRFSKGGVHSLMLKPEVALEDSVPGACTVWGKDAAHALSKLVISGEPGTLLRFAFFAVVSSDATRAESDDFNQAFNPFELKPKITQNELFQWPALEQTPATELPKPGESG